VTLTPEGERVREAGAGVTRKAEALLLEPLSAEDAERLRAALHQVVRTE